MKTFLTISLLTLASSMSYAVTFEAYKDTLETDVLCGDYKGLKPVMHFQMLKETAKLSSNTLQNGKENKYKILSNEKLFGYDLKEVMLVTPDRTNKNQAIGVLLKGDSSEIAKKLNSKIEKNFGAKVQSFQPGVYFWNNPEKHAFELNISKVNQNETQIICGPFLP